MKKTISLIFTLFITLTMVACGGSDDDTPAAAVVVTCPSTIGGLAVSTTTIINSGKPTCSIADGTITSAATLDSTRDWVLAGKLQSDDQALTINSGVNVYGAGTNSYIFINASATINANGTDANPVRLLSLDADFNGRGEWGGLFIRSTGANKLDYTVVAEAGAPITMGSGTYNDNIVINGASSLTLLTFVQSHDSARDGIRLQNTDARLSWILVTGAARDGIWYRDFNGLVKDYMAINWPDTAATPTAGRSGIYASASTTTVTSNPRFVNVTLFGNDDSSTTDASATNREYGILLANNTNAGRFANVAIANYRNGCFEADSTTNLTGFNTSNYLDGIHCANAAGPNNNFFANRGSTVFPVGIIAENNSNNNGINYYNGSSTPIAFTGNAATRSFTAGWYVSGLGGGSNITNGGNTPDGIAATNVNSPLNRFRGGDTDGDSILEASAAVLPGFTGGDIGATPFLGNTSNAFFADVDSDTGGYDLTHVGAVRSGADGSAAQFNNWTVSTGANEGFCLGSCNP